MGRHSTFTQEVADAICARLAKGEALAQICRDDGMPAVRTVSDWKDSDEQFSADFARAREEGFDFIAAQTLEIADDGRNDWMEKHNADGEVVGQVLNAEHVQRSKLRIETRLKLLAKWDPKRYGDKVLNEHAGPDEG